MQTTLNVDIRTTAGDISNWLRTVPPMAKVSVAYTSADRPQDRDQGSITARWTQSVKEV
jgi:hypothetical protein